MQFQNLLSTRLRADTRSLSVSAKPRLISNRPVKGSWSWPAAGIAPWRVRSPRLPKPSDPRADRILTVVIIALTCSRPGMPGAFTPTVGFSSYSTGEVGSPSRKREASRPFNWEIISKLQRGNCRVHPVGESTPGGRRCSLNATHKCSSQRDI